MPEINLIKLEGKPLEKLIEVISNGIGVLYKPRAIRKEADANAYQIEIIEKAKTKAIAEGKESEADTYLRIKERLLFREVEKQNNIDNVSEIAAEQLSQEENISEEPVNKDWSKRFFNIVEDVSDEEMQALWGKILAGEIKSPESYSLRTLEILKNLSKKEAEIFMKFATLAISSSSNTFILNFKNEKLLEKTYSLKFSDRLLLEELGFLTANDLQFTIGETKQQKGQSIFINGKTIVVFEKPNNQPKQQLQILVFTKIGRELLKLVNKSANLDYIQLLASKLRKDNYSLKYGIILKKNKNGDINHTHLIEIPLTSEEQRIKKQKEEKKENKKN
ncbi:MAG: DUF2806 domain-containing protein [Polaribacter sp.]|uniref:DUF2806 domain-containing protein n=1 Tax=Polaribacter sp. TaxID=1920175 RepID=UPI003EFB0F58